MKKNLLILLSLLYIDLVFIVFSNEGASIYSIINIFLFAVINSGIIFFLTSLFKDKVNYIMKYVIFSFLGVWYNVYFLFDLFFQTPFSIALIRQSDQAAGFAGNTLELIFTNLHLEVFFFMPLILLFFFRKDIKEINVLKKDKVIVGILLPIAIIIYLINPFIQPKGPGSTYNLLYENDNTSLNIKNLGVMGSTFVDIYRTIFGFEEKITEIPTPEKPENPEEPEEPEIKYEYNRLHYTFPNNDQISNFLKKEEGTLQNEFTGKFKGKNLIFIVGESFSELAVDKELTPTLYKLVNEGFNFKNFYTSNNLSTIGGEFQAITGLYADNAIFTKWREGTNTFPNGLANVFRNEGYNTFAYHNHNGFFQDRNKYLSSQGFKNFKACRLGLEKMMNCSWWPNSDILMMETTTKEYINSKKPFLTYYVTVSGHLNYTQRGNRIVAKNWSLVKDLPYRTKVKGYMATQMELDKAMKVLMDKLENAGKLKDTVIVLVADHYPYGLSLDDINSFSSYRRDEMIEVNSNNLIIYNSEMTPTEIEKVGMSIDVIPTVYNLFGIKFDSRIIMGKDILSTTEGIAIFKDKSWVTNKGTYHASSKEFVPNEGISVDENYITRINGIVSNRILISKNIILKNYYKNLK